MHFTVGCVQIMVDFSCPLKRTNCQYQKIVFWIENNMGVVLVHGLVPDVQTLTPDLIPTPNLFYQVRAFKIRTPIQE